MQKLHAAPYLQLWDWLLHLHTGLHICTCSAHHFASFQVIYKQDPILPGTFLPNETFPSSMDTSSNGLASLTERQQYDTNVKKCYHNVHQQLMTGFMGG